MSGRVKKEVEETDLIKPQPFHEENRKYVEDGDVILAQLAHSLSSSIFLFLFLSIFIILVSNRITPPDASDLAFFFFLFFLK